MAGAPIRPGSKLKATYRRRWRAFLTSRCSRHLLCPKAVGLKSTPRAAGWPPEAPSSTITAIQGKAVKRLKRRCRIIWESPILSGFRERQRYKGAGTAGRLLPRAQDCAHSNGKSYGGRGCHPLCDPATTYGIEKVGSILTAFLTLTN